MTVQVSEISLKNCSTGGTVRAELRDAIEEQQLLDWLTAWQPLIRSVVLDLVARGVPPSQWPQSWHWNWPAKMARVAGLLAYRGFCVTCDGLTQGLMRLNLTSLAREATQVGKPLVYVEYLEVAPWNRADGGQAPRYQGVGTALLVAAVALSFDEGFKGRTGLHSLPQSDGFYRDGCRMIDLGPDEHYQGLRYFEMTEAAAETFLAEEAAE
jgi:hypothetical protein